MSTSSPAMTPEMKAFSAAERKTRAEKRGLRSKVLVALIGIMTAIYFGDSFGLDAVVYGLVGFVDGMFTSEWLPQVKASLGTIKMMGFAGCAAGAWFLSKQEA